MLYEVVAVNETGIDGQSYLVDGESYQTSSPTSDEPGTNPEQLMGLSLATCFNATLHAVLKEREIEPKSRVQVTVQLHQDEVSEEYYFTLNLTAAVADIPLDEAETIIQATHKRCPVAKIVGDYKHLTVETVPFEA